MPHCPTCGHFLRDDQWMLAIECRVQPYYPPSERGARCDLCGCLKSTAPTARQREQGVRIDPWGQITGFDGAPIRLKSDGIQQHNRNLTQCGVTTVFHQTNFEAAEKIIASQTFRPGSDGCVGQGMYAFAFPHVIFVTFCACTLLKLLMRHMRRHAIAVLFWLRKFGWAGDGMCRSKIPRTAHGTARRHARKP